MTVVEWLLDSDPAIRWQALRDLTDASEGEVAAERARVAAEGWGARLLEELPIVADPASGAELGRSWRLMPDGARWLTCVAARRLMRESRSGIVDDG